MYSRRQQSYRDQVLQQPHDDYEEDQESVRSETSIPSTVGGRSEIIEAPRLSIPTNLANTQRIAERARQQEEEDEEKEEEDEGEEEQEEEIERTANGAVKVTYTSTFRKTIPKRTTWHQIPTPVLAQVRKILTDNYIKTLNHIAGVTHDSDHPEAERVLRRIAQHTDRRLKAVLVPGFVATNQLNSATSEAIENVKAEFNAKLRQVAKQILMEEKRIELLEQEKEELEQLKAERDVKKQELEASSLYKQKRAKSNDYVQSLMRYPISSAYDV